MNTNTIVQCLFSSCVSFYKRSLNLKTKMSSCNFSQKWLNNFVSRSLDLYCCQLEQQTNKLIRKQKKPFTNKLIRIVLLIVLSLVEAAAAAGRNNGHFPAI